mmetsp:Transcript_93530/g.241682  ORF Transcript_93530/g.241682 Transcript_93530/m.241682 type:complete len:287 (+) Transcript_93530:294-1154(+)
MEPIQLERALAREADARRAVVGVPTCWRRGPQRQAWAWVRVSGGRRCKFGRRQKNLWHAEHGHPAGLAHGGEQLARKRAVRLQRHPTHDDVQGLHAPWSTCHWRVIAEVPLPEGDDDGSADRRLLPAGHDLLHGLLRGTRVLDLGRLDHGADRGDRAPGAVVLLDHVVHDLGHEVRAKVRPQWLRALPELDVLVLDQAELPPLHLRNDDETRALWLHVKHHLRLGQALRAARALQRGDQPQLLDVFVGPCRRQVRVVRIAFPRASRVRERHEHVASGSAHGADVEA